MLIAVGKTRYIIPTTAIRESFRVEDHHIIADAEGNELLMIRGECYNVARLHRQFSVENAADKLKDGIIVMVEDDSGALCLFADELVGEQQVVVKPIPAYLRKTRGLAGCTILGDGSISLILDISGLIKTH
jgi:two-component system chemotaxis sensor kinase CheA